MHAVCPSATSTVVAAVTSAVPALRCTHSIVSCFRPSSHASHHSAPLPQLPNLQRSIRSAAVGITDDKMLPPSHGGTCRQFNDTIVRQHHRDFFNIARHRTATNPQLMPLTTAAVTGMASTTRRNYTSGSSQEVCPKCYHHIFVPESPLDGHKKVCDEVQQEARQCYQQRLKEEKQRREGLALCAFWFYVYYILCRTFSFIFSFLCVRNTLIRETPTKTYCRRSKPLQKVRAAVNAALASSSGDLMFPPFFSKVYSNPSPFQSIPCFQLKSLPSH